ncbi:MAG: tetratricopeptide repeat protein, partial [Candidatus Omnitrophica bacterium]|nr:tetratricopeptide repeat protein [Candidatus Omnitrophota bacterium]
MNLQLNSPLISLFLIVVLATGIFLPTLRQGFVSWDDDVHLTNNVQVRELSLTSIKNIFHSQVNKTYIPLTVLSFAIEYKFFGYRPWIYHLNNLLLHLSVVVLVYVLALRLGLPTKAANFAALIFALHPMHVESVAWVTQRKDVLYSFFYLLSLWFYTGYIRTRNGSSFFVAVLFAFLSVLSKPMALSLPLIYCLVDWFLNRPWGKRIVLEKVLAALIVWPIAWLTYAMNMRQIDVEGASALLTWVWSLAFYISKFLFPVNLLILYQLPHPVTITNPAFLWAVIVALILIFMCVRWRRHRLMIFAAAYFFASIFFLLRFDDSQDLTFVADRFMYLPSIGFCLLFASVVERVLEKTRQNRFAIILKGFIVFMIAGMAVTTHERVVAWGNEPLLWKQTEKYSLSAVVYNRLGNYYLDQQDYLEAIEYYRKAIALNPRYHKPYSNRGIAYLRMGNAQEAISDFTRSIELFPEQAATAYNNRGYAYSLLG